MRRFIECMEIKSIHYRNTSRYIPKHLYFTFTKTDNHDCIIYIYVHNVKYQYFLITRKVDNK